MGSHLFLLDLLTRHELADCSTSPGSDLARASSEPALSPAGRRRGLRGRPNRLTSCSISASPACVSIRPPKGHDVADGRSHHRAVAEVPPLLGERVGVREDRDSGSRSSVAATYSRFMGSFNLPFCTRIGAMNPRLLHLIRPARWAGHLLPRRAAEKAPPEGRFMGSSTFPFDLLTRHELADCSTSPGSDLARASSEPALSPAGRRRGLTRWPRRLIVGRVSAPRASSSIVRSKGRAKSQI